MGEARALSEKVVGIELAWDRKVEIVVVVCLRLSGAIITWGPRGRGNESVREKVSEGSVKESIDPQLNKVDNCL